MKNLLTAVWGVSILGTVIALIYRYYEPFQYETFHLIMSARSILNFVALGLLIRYVIDLKVSKLKAFSLLIPLIYPLAMSLVMFRLYNLFGQDLVFILDRIILIGLSVAIYGTIFKETKSRVFQIYLIHFALYLVHIILLNYNLSISAGVSYLMIIRNIALILVMNLPVENKYSESRATLNEN